MNEKAGHSSLFLWNQPDFADCKSGTGFGGDV